MPGKLYTWGQNSNGSLGHGVSGASGNKNTPTQLGSDTDWEYIAAGAESCFAIRGGRLYSWGTNYLGVLGLGDTNHRSTPTQVGSWEDWDKVAASRFGSHALGLRNGEIYSWGFNGSGQLGLGNTLSQSTPTQVGSLSDWTHVSAGSISSYAIRDGKLYSWGYNFFGQLGHGDTTQRTTPTQVGSDTDWQEISTGHHYCVALKGGSLWAWGYNDSGGLTDGTTTNQLSPVEIDSDTDWESLADFFHFAFRDGKIFAFGEDYLGTLGLGTVTNPVFLTQVGFDTDWSSASTAGYHSLAIKNGTLQATGPNDSGQLGTGNTTNRNTFIQIGSSTDWVQVSAGYSHSMAIEEVPNTPPANTAVPTISGTAKVGQTLTASDGTWTATPGPSFAYQWQQADTADGSYSNITGATSATYVLQISDVGKYIKVSVTATNSEGSASATSVATSQVLEDPAISTPIISGTTKVGQVLTASASATAGVPSPSISYQWQRADTSGGTYSSISGATSSSYTLVSADAGKYIKVAATATNSEGSTSATSVATSQVLEDPAISTPIISGTTKVGQVLTASASATAGVPSPSISYQWQRADTSGGTYSSISGATSSTYELTTLDAGKYIKVEVTATNSEGFDSATSDPSDQIRDNPVISPPTISGTTIIGETLTASNGIWTGTPAPTFTYRWQSASTEDGDFSNITAATSSTYVIRGSDSGKYLRVEITGTNSEGSDTEISNVLGPVIPIIPSDGLIWHSSRNNIDTPTEGLIYWSRKKES